MLHRLALTALFTVSLISHAQSDQTTVQLPSATTHFPLPSFNTILNVGGVAFTVGIEALTYTDFYHTCALLHPTAQLTPEVIERTRTILKTTGYAYADTVPLYPLSSHAYIPVITRHYSLYINPQFAQFCTSEHPAYQRVYETLITYAGLSLKYHVSLKNSAIKVTENITVSTAHTLTMNHSFFKTMGNGSWLNFFKGVACSVAISVIYSKCLQMLTSAYFSYANTALLKETIKATGYAKTTILEDLATVIKDPYASYPPAITQFLHTLYVVFNKLPPVIETASPVLPASA
jgi:hypothetical protein